ncbi:Conserved_hypothetical protein [Hexamita inflata]|uniref:Uncharacterized protein n=1 Tax=Hexamita inflata TaxID=28002 RepID=A0AA86TX38_9EUKA|nr:Conserved hypothetical protein [Hexamita inflata]
MSDSESFLSDASYDDASDYGDLAGIEDIFGNNYLKNIFDSEEFKEAHQIQKPVKVAEKFSIKDELKTRVSEDLASSFVYSERQPLQHLAAELLRLKVDIPTLHQQTTTYVMKHMFCFDKYDEIFYENEQHFKVQKKCFGGSEPVEQLYISNKLIKISTKYFTQIVEYCNKLEESLRLMYSQAEQVSNLSNFAQQVQHLREEMQTKLESIKLFQENKDTNHRAHAIENIILDQKIYFMSIFDACLSFFADFSSQPLQLYFYQEKEIHLTPPQLSKLKQLGVAQPSAQQDLQKTYKEIQTELAKCGQKQIDQQKSFQVINNIIGQMMNGKEAVCFVIRQISGFESIQNLFESQEDGNVFSRFQKCGSQQQYDQSFYELLPLRIQQMSVKFLRVQIDKTKFNLNSGLKEFKNFGLKQFENDLISSEIIHEFKETWIENDETKQIMDCLQEIEYVDEKNIVSGKSSLMDIIGKLDLSSAEASRTATSLITTYPKLIEIYAIHWLLHGTVTVYQKDASLKTLDIKKTATELYNKLIDKQNTWDLESPLTYGFDQSEAYNPNDTFAPVLFINDQPLLLNTQQCASGLHRYLYLQIAYLMEAGEKIKVKFESKINLISDENSSPQLKSINKILKEKSMLLASKILKSHAMNFIQQTAYQQLMHNIQITPFNPLVLKDHTGSIDSYTQPHNMVKPFFNFDDSYENMGFIAAIKNYRVCICIPKFSFGGSTGNINYTTFVTLDSHGHYISQLTLTTYDKPLFNPLNDQEHKTRLISYLKSNGCDQSIDDQTLKIIDKKVIEEIVTSSFTKFKAERDENIQRIIDEAKLMDYLASQSVCCVTVAMTDFESTEIFRNLEQTIKYLNQPVADQLYDMQTLTVKDIDQFHEKVSIPIKGLNTLIGKNPLYINDLVFKKIKLAQHIKLVLLTQTPVQVPIQLSEIKEINQFDLSMDKNQSALYAMTTTEKLDLNKEQYIRLNNKYCSQILENLIVQQEQEKIKNRVPAIGKYGTGFYADYDSQRTPKLEVAHKTPELSYYQQIPQLQTNTDVILHQKVIRIAIWTGRFLLDPLACYCALTLGGSKIKNLLTSNIIDFVPELLPSKTGATQLLLKEICPQQDKFYQNVTLSPDMQTMALYALQVAVSKRCYDINLPFVNSHYIYPLLFVPYFTPRKLLNILAKSNQPAVTFKEIENYVALKSQLELMQVENRYLKQNNCELLLDDRISDIKDQLTMGMNNHAQDINIFGIAIDQKNERQGEYFISKIDILNIIAEHLLLDTVIKHLCESEYESQIGQEALERLDSNLIKKLEQITNSQQTQSLYMNLSQEFKNIDYLHEFQHEIETQLNAMSPKYDYTQIYKKQILFANIITQNDKNFDKPISEFINKLSLNDLKIVIQKANSLYESISNSTVLTPDTLLQTPTSPYSQPINVAYLLENESHVMLYALSKMFKYYSIQFDIEQYLINDFYFSTKITKEMLANKIDRSWLLAADECNLHIAAVSNAFGTQYTRGGVFDEFSNSDDEEINKHKKKTAKNSKQQAINYSSLYIRNQDFDVKWFDQLPLNLQEIQLFFLIASLMKHFEPKQQEFEEIFLNVDTNVQQLKEYTQKKHLFDFIQQNDTIGKDIFNNKDIIELIQQMNEQATTDEQFVVRIIMADSSTHSYPIKNFSDLIVNKQVSNIEGLVAYVKEGPRTRATFVEKCKNSPSYPLFCLEFLNRQNNFATPTKQEEEIEVDDNQTVNGQYILTSFKQKYFKNHFSYNSVLDREKEFLEIIQGNLFLTLYKDKNVKSFLPILLQQFSQFDTSIRQMFSKISNFPKLYTLMGTFFEKYIAQKSPVNQYHGIFTLDSVKEYKFDVVEGFLYQANARNIKEFQRFTEVQVQIPPSLALQYKEAKSSEVYRISCVGYNGLKGVVKAFNKDEINIDQPFTAFIDTLDLEQEKYQLVLMTHVTYLDKEIQICDLMAQLQENQWRAVLLNLILSTESARQDGLNTFKRDAYNQQDVFANNGQFPLFNAQVAQSEDLFLRMKTNEAYKQDMDKFSDIKPEQLFLYRQSLSYLTFCASLQQNSARVDTFRDYCLLQQFGISALEQTSLLGNDKKVQLIQPKVLCALQAFRFCERFCVKLQTEQEFIQSLALTLEGKEEFAPILTLPSLLEQEYLDPIQIMRMFMRFNSADYKNKLKELLNPQILKLNFKRTITDSRFDADLLYEQLTNYFQKTQKQVIFIPKQDDYYSIQLAMYLKARDLTGNQCGIVKVFENPDQKPALEGLTQIDQLSKQLIIKPYYRFTNLYNNENNPLPPQTLEYETIDKILEKFHTPFALLFKQVLKASVPDIKPYAAIGQPGYWFVLKSAKDFKFDFYFRVREGGSLTCESVYVVFQGFIFRHTFIKGDLKDFMSWMKVNYQKYGLNTSTNKYRQTKYDKE